MQRSTERFLTTHTGSLPRPDDLIKTMFAKEEGVPIDPDALAGRVRSAVEEIVSRQVDAGVDVVNDGEMSKPSYATYVKDRLGGFNGTSQPLTYQDLTEFPVLRDKVFGDPGRSRRKTPACTDDIVVVDHEAPRTDARNLVDALDGRKGMGFLTAASPGVIALFFRNDHYATREEYLYAIADAMKEEYDAVAAAGLVLQLDCPDLAMGRHIQFAGDDLDDFRAHARRERRGDEPRAARHPAGAAAHARLLGQLRGSAPPRRAVLGHRRHRVRGQAGRRSPSRRRTRATRTSGRCSRTSKLPDGKVLIPGVLESKANFIEHPELIAQRIERYAKLVGPENVVAGSDCGYGTWVGQAAVDPDVVWAKLAVLAEGARIASDRCFS